MVSYAGAKSLKRQQGALHSRWLDVTLEGRNEPIIGYRLNFLNIDADDEFCEEGSRRHADGAPIASEARLLHDRALWAIIVRFFKRLFGKDKEVES